VLPPLAPLPLAPPRSFERRASSEPPLHAAIITPAQSAPHKRDFPSIPKDYRKNHAPVTLMIDVSADARATHTEPIHVLLGAASVSTVLGEVLLSQRFFAS
jgi:hypothetical protein